MRQSVFGDVEAAQPLWKRWYCQCLSVSALVLFMLLWVEFALSLYYTSHTFGDSARLAVRRAPVNARNAFGLVSDTQNTSIDGRLNDRIDALPTVFVNRPFLHPQFERVPLSEAVNRSDHLVKHLLKSVLKEWTNELIIRDHAAHNAQGNVIETNQSTTNRSIEYQRREELREYERVIDEYHTRLPISYDDSSIDNEREDDNDNDEDGGGTGGGAGSKVIRVAIVTVMSGDILTKDSKYSLFHSAFTQLSKLLLSKSLNDYYYQSTKNNRKRFRIEIDVVFDTFDYMGLFNETGHVYDHTLSETQLKECTSKDSIKFNNFERCVTPLSMSVNGFNERNKGNKDHLNCTGFNQTIDIRFNKVLSLQYWSSHYDLLLCTDDDTWIGFNHVPIRNALDQALFGLRKEWDNKNTIVPNDSYSNNNNHSHDLRLCQPSSNHYLFVPFDMYQWLRFFNHAFLLDVRSEKRGRMFLRQWWDNRQRVWTHADQGACWRTILQVMRDYLIHDGDASNTMVHTSNNNDNHHPRRHLREQTWDPRYYRKCLDESRGWLKRNTITTDIRNKTVECIDYCELCFGFRCLDTCLKDELGLKRSSQQGSGDWRWDGMPLVFMGDKESSFQGNWKAYPPIQDSDPTSVWRQRIAHKSLIHYRTQGPSKKLDFNSHFYELYRSLF